MIADVEQLLLRIRRLHEIIRDQVLAACEGSALADMAAVATDDDGGDTIYAIDRIGEDLLIDYFAREVAPSWPLLLIAEGLPTGAVTLPVGLAAEEALIRVIVDPIDGTRGLMYQKRSAWILTGVAPNRGPATGLRDIELAVQTEIPLVKQHLSDMLWAMPGGDLQVERYNRLNNERSPIRLRPSQANDLAHGFAMISRFFPGARAELASIDDALIRRLLGPPRAGKAQCFEDQYISSAGQLYELIAGHDRFVADLRPLIDRKLAGSGEAIGICCHPYDLAGLLLAERAGVIVTDAYGAPLDAPLNLDADVSWVGYANARLHASIEPLLQEELRRRALIV